MPATLSEQTVFFLWSILFGGGLALCYEIIRAVRASLTKKGIYMILSDVLFFFFAGILTSLFSLPFNKGEVRGFILLGEAAGFLTVHLTLGVPVFRLLYTIAAAIQKILSKISKLFKKFFTLLLKFMHFILYNVNELIDKVKRKRLHHKARNISHEQKRKRKKTSRRSGRRDSGRTAEV